MAEMVTLELSQAVVERARQTASRTGRSVEAVLTEWLERSVLSEDVMDLMAGAEYPIYTPYGNEAAAQTLFEALQESAAIDNDENKEH
jgi:plasmid stability protein